MDHQEYSTEDLKELCNFLSEFNWLFDFRWLDFFILNQWQYLPDSWIDFCSIDCFESLHSHQYCNGTKCILPDSLCLFLKKCHVFSQFSSLTDVGLTSDATKLSKHESRNMTPKKKHEIEIVSSIIKQLSEETFSDCVVDIGCGVGYLDVVLAEKCNLNVIGVEMDKERLTKGEKHYHRKKSLSAADSRITWLQFNLSAEDDVINDLVTELNRASVKQPHENICLSSLHACGDLSPALLKMFAHHKNFKSLICFSCCYHKMETNLSNEIINFPLSNALKSIVAETGFALSVHGARMACEASLAKWRAMTVEQRHRHVSYVCYRAVLEEALVELNISLKRRCKKLSKKPSVNSFSDYIDYFIEQNILSEADSSKLKHLAGRKYSIHESEGLLTFVSMFCHLQLYMQRVIERLITIDRCLFLKDSLKSSEVFCVPVFCEQLSPRNIAIVARKRIDS